MQKNPVRVQRDAGPPAPAGREQINSSAKKTRESKRRGPRLTPWRGVKSAPVKRVTAATAHWAKKCSGRRASKSRDRRPLSGAERPGKEKRSDGRPVKLQTGQTTVEKL